MAKESKTLTAEQKEKIRRKDEALLSEAKKTEAVNKAQVEKLIAEGEAYLKAHYKTEYLDRIKASGAAGSCRSDLFQESGSSEGGA